VRKERILWVQKWGNAWHIDDALKLIVDKGGFKVDSGVSE